MKGFVRFLAYHNAVPISISMVLLTSGAAFAASPEVRSEVSNAVLSTDTQVIAMDNTYIANKDLSSYTPRVLITGVTEDADSYYVAYRLTTIDVREHVWQDVVVGDTMKVDKALLGASRDLGEYATAQLGQTIDHEASKLREVQQIERRQVTQKTVSIVYGGLVGKFMDDTTEVLPGYTPVIVPPPPEVIARSNAQAEGQAAAAAVAEVSPPSANDTLPPATIPVPAPPQVNVSGGPQIQILGNNPARITVKTSYIDLGVIALDAAGVNLGVRVFVNDSEKSSVQLDTYTVGTWHIRYETIDGAGRMATAERIVEVYDPYAPVTASEIASTTPPTP